MLLHNVEQSWKYIKILSIYVCISGLIRIKDKDKRAKLLSEDFGFNVSIG